MARRNRRSKRSSAGSDWKIIGLIIALVLIIAGVVGGLIYKYVSKETHTLDAQTHCPIVNGRVTPTGHLVVLIDATTPLTTVQREYLQMRVNRLVKSELLPGQMLSLYYLGDNFQESRKPICELCKLRDGSNADPLTENENMMRRSFNQKFRKPFIQALDRASANTKESPDSPIFEELQSIAINSFDRWDADGERRLVIFSDMLHNTNRYSLYRASNFDFDRFKRTAYSNEVRTYLPDVSVDLYYLMNQPRLQNNRNTEFWKSYFRNTGALVESIVPVGK